MSAKYLFLICILSLVVSSCSSNEKKSEAKGSGGSQANKSALEGGDDEMFDDEDEESDGEGDVELFKSSAAPAKNKEVEVQPVQITGDAGEYTVEKGDTLMLVAFKLYGDYGKWKMLAGYNPGIKQSGLKEGTVLKYQMPEQKFSWSPQGNPHLISWGETLGSISNDKYGTMKRWKEVFDNNQPMIKDANLIFAGFTLYYVPDDRGLASEKKK